MPRVDWFPSDGRYASGPHGEAVAHDLSPDPERPYGVRYRQGAEESKEGPTYRTMLRAIHAAQTFVESGIWPTEKNLESHETSFRRAAKSGAESRKGRALVTTE